MGQLSFMVLLFCFLSSMASGGSLVQKKVSAVIELSNWFLQDDLTTLAFNQTEGVGKTSFLIQLDENNAILISFGWNVRPIAKPTLLNAVSVFQKQVKKIQVNLSFDGKVLKGDFSVGPQKYQVSEEHQKMKTIKVWSAPDKFDFVEFDRLLGPIPLKVLKPKSGLMD